ncbi:hypothetical protein D3C71_1286660 [compost metagenome]
MFVMEEAFELPNLLAEFNPFRGIEERRRVGIATASAADTAIDTPGEQSLEYAEVLGHLVGGMVGQHHAPRTKPNPIRLRSDGCKQHFRRRSLEDAHIVMFG